MLCSLHMAARQAHVETIQVFNPSPMFCAHQIADKTVPSFFCTMARALLPRSKEEFSKDVLRLIL